ncbi:MAG: DUF5320 domain-containing protein [Thermoanaerobaculaceae bacterium]|nr:DUF5320 domain-containing protein [Thermoanaerobaculaceae bacterium]
MPYGDRRGPVGLGPRSGRGLGYCSGYDSPGYTKGIPRMGGIGRGKGFYSYGMGRSFGCFGRGRGWRNMFYATGLPGWARFYDFPNTEQNLPNEEDFLSNQVSFLEEQLKSAKRRLDEIKNEKEEK